MKRELQYVGASACTTIGILLWFTASPSFALFGPLLISACSLFLQGAKLTEPIRFNRPQWKPKKLLNGALLVLGAALFIIMLFHMPRELLKRWYFLGPFWLLFMLALTKRYIEEKEEAQQRPAPDEASVTAPAKQGPRQGLR